MSTSKPLGPESGGETQESIEPPPLGATHGTGPEAPSKSSDQIINQPDKWLHRSKEPSRESGGPESRGPRAPVSIWLMQEDSRRAKRRRRRWHGLRGPDPCYASACPWRRPCGAQPGEGHSAHHRHWAPRGQLWIVWLGKEEATAALGTRVIGQGAGCSPPPAEQPGSVPSTCGRCWSRVEGTMNDIGLLSLSCRNLISCFNLTGEKPS